MLPIRPGHQNRARSNKMGSKTAPPIHRPAPQATVDDPARLRQVLYTPRLTRESLDIAAIVQQHGIGRPNGFPAPTAKMNAAAATKARRRGRHAAAARC